MRKKIVVFMMLVALIGFLGDSQVVEAICVQSPYQGRYVNYASSGGLVENILIIIPCGDNVNVPSGEDRYEAGIKHPMIEVWAKCGFNYCDWGWSPGVFTEDGLSDWRFWNNARTRQTFTLLADGRLKVITEVTFNDGTSQEFIDYLQRFSDYHSEPFPSLNIIAEIESVSSKTSDGALAGGNDLYVNTWFTFGAYKSGQGRFLTTELSLDSGSVDFIVQLKDDDGWFTGGDDILDIHPNVSEKELRVRVYPEAGYVYLVENGERSEFLGLFNEPITVEGYHSSDQGRITFRLSTTHIRRQLLLPSTTSGYTHSVNPNILSYVSGGGGNGGSVMSLYCPDNYVATGFILRTGSRVDQMQVMCRYLFSFGSLGNYLHTTDSVGGQGGSIRQLECPYNSVLVGIFGRSGSRVDNLGVYCAGIKDGTTIQVGPYGGAGGSEFVSLCPTNSIITGIYGRSGNEVDQINLRCSQLERD